MLHQQITDRSEVGGHEDAVHAAWVQKASLTDLMHEGQQSVVIAIEIGQHDRLVMGAGLPASPHLEEFLQRANAAGQDEEGLALLHHADLALDHGVDHLQVGQAVQHGLGFHEVAGNNPHHMALLLNRRLGHRAHQAPAARTKHQAPALLGDEPAHVRRNGGPLVMVAEF
ncbi:MAG: hypothetical protein RLY30_295 [Pseudomonadota bacterium]